MIRPVPLLRLSLAAFVLLAMGCTEPRCPRNLVQDRMVCRKCPEGAFVKNNLCMYPDGGEADAGQETDEGSSNASEGDVLDGGADEGSTTVDAAVNPTDAGGSAIESGSADGAFPTADAAPVDAGS